MYHNAWTDIGYHYIVSSEGPIYEGRDIRVRGAHVDSRNTGKIGVLLLGDFSPGRTFECLNIQVTLPLDFGGDDRPTKAQVNSTIALIRWLDYEYGIEDVVGHRDVDSTLCPGEYCMALIPVFNAIAQER
jgi:N-acetyl-anhydromuramyl-L-alanine amidase AmpD